MNRKILLTVLALAAVMLAAPYVGMVYAGQPPTPITFGVLLTGVDMGTLDYRQNGPNWIGQYTSFGVVSGDIEGSMTGHPFWIYNHWVGPIEDPFMTAVEKGNGHVLITLDVTSFMGVEKTGTLTVLFRVGQPTVFAGTWVIIGDTGDLEGVHGQGTWYIDWVAGIQVFEGQIILF